MTSQFCHNKGKLKTGASKFVLLQEIFVLYLEKGIEKNVTKMKQKCGDQEIKVNGSKYLGNVFLFVTF